MANPHGPHEPPPIESPALGFCIHPSEAFAYVHAASPNPFNPRSKGSSRQDSPGFGREAAAVVAGATALTMLRVTLTATLDLVGAAACLGPKLAVKVGLLSACFSRSSDFVCSCFWG